MSENIITDPIQLSQPMGAALAYTGVKGCVPLWHGVQGCTAFGKILALGHFMEPVSFQTTAMGHNEVVLGGEGNLMQAIENLLDGPEVIGLLTTGVAETSGADLAGTVKQAKSLHPDLKIAYCHTPDFEHSLERGWQKACKALLEEFALASAETVKGKVAFMMGPYFTPAEVRELKRIARDLGWSPLAFPDLDLALLGRLPEETIVSTGLGGVALEEIGGLSRCELVISVGASMKGMAREFCEKSAIEHRHFDHLAQLDELDAFYKALLQGRPLPPELLRERQHLQDMLLDVEVHYYGKEAVIAGDPELIRRYLHPLTSMGIETQGWSGIKTKAFRQGDLMDLEEDLRETRRDLLLGNSHVARLAESLQIGKLRVGLPIMDRLGGHRQCHLGYFGAASLYQDLANALLEAAEHPKAPAMPLKRTLLKTTLLEETP